MDRDSQTLERTGYRMVRGFPAFVFLASPVCSSYITGAVLPVMGGPTG